MSLACSACLHTLILSMSWYSELCGPAPSSPPPTLRGDWGESVHADVLSQCRAFKCIDGDTMRRTLSWRRLLKGGLSSHILQHLLLAWVSVKGNTLQKNMQEWLAWTAFDIINMSFLIKCKREMCPLLLEQDRHVFMSWSAWEWESMQEMLHPV